MTRRLVLHHAYDDSAGDGEHGARATSSFDPSLVQRANGPKIPAGQDDFLADLGELALEGVQLLLVRAGRMTMAQKPSIATRITSNCAEAGTTDNSREGNGFRAPTLPWPAGSRLWRADCYGTEGAV